MRLTILLMSWALQFSMPSISFAAPNCLKEFTQRVCLSGKDGKQICGPEYVEVRPYIAALAEVSDFMDHDVVSLLCTLEKLEISTDLSGSVGLYNKNTKIVEIDERMFTGHHLLEEYFAGGYSRYFERADDVKYVVRGYTKRDRNIVNSSLGGLYWVLVHELGHHLENMFLLGGGFDCLNNQPMNNRFAAPYATEIDAILVDDKSKIDGKSIVSFNSWLNKSGFVSPYSIWNDAEDFAETFTFYFLSHRNAIDLSVVADQATEFSSRSAAFVEGKKLKFETIDYLLDHFVLGDSSVGMKVLTCSYLSDDR